jgi:hypothetical protein
MPSRVASAPDDCTRHRRPLRRYRRKRNASWSLRSRSRYCSSAARALAIRACRARLPGRESCGPRGTACAHRGGDTGCVSPRALRFRGCGSREARHGEVRRSPDRARGCVGRGARAAPPDARFAVHGRTPLSSAQGFGGKGVSTAAPRWGIIRPRPVVSAKGAIGVSIAPIQARGGWLTPIRLPGRRAGVPDSSLRAIHARGHAAR